MNENVNFKGLKANEFVIKKQGMETICYLTFFYSLISP